jgi:radical SAM superfamily enzyme YgiQ (UPF0313 family)
VKQRVHEPLAETLRAPGAILLVSCYELGHQPLGLASPLGFLERAGFTPEALDIAVERFDREKAARARFVGISVPMHTALRLGVRVAEEVRRVNPRCHICFYGLYASLNADYLLGQVADSVIGGEFETALGALVEALQEGRAEAVQGVHRRGQPASPVLKRLQFPVPSRHGLPGLEKYARLERDGARALVGYVEASRGCLHMCLHCPIPPVYGGRFFVVPRGIVLEDIRRLVRSGASHITFGDPDFLNGPGHSLAIVRAMHQEFPALTFDFTAKVEHILERRVIFPELAALGSLFVVSAVESLSDTVLANLEKGHTRGDVLMALEIVRAAGIAFRPTWVQFTPWTTLDDSSTSSSSSRPRGSSITWTRCSTRSGFWSRRAPRCSSGRRSARFWGRSTRPRSAIAGPTPIPVWIASTGPSAGWSRRRRRRRRTQRSRSSGSASSPRRWQAWRAVKATGRNR